MGEIFNPESPAFPPMPTKLTAKKTERYRKALALIEQGVSVPSIAQALAVSIKTLKRWLADPAFLQLQTAAHSPTETLVTVEHELRQIGLDPGITPYVRVHALRALASLVSEREVTSDMNRRLDQLESKHDRS